MATAQIKLLIVEDDPEDARLLQLMLYQAAPGLFEETVAARLADALEYLRTTQFDLILADLDLPDSRGLATFLQVRAHAAETPVIVLSGLADEKTAVAALRKGAEDYLMKGEANGGHIARTLRHTVEKHHQRTTGQTNGAERGKVLAFLGAKGGVGTTTVALNVAAALAQSKARVILCELHPSLGGLSLLLQRPPPLGNLSEILDLPAANINADEVGARLASGPAGLRVLYGPQKPEEFKEIEPERCLNLLEELAHLAEYVVLDLPSQPSEANRAALRAADRVGLVVERDPLCVACASAVLRALKPWGVAQARAVVVDRAALAAPLPLPVVQRQLGCELVGNVPLAADEFLEAHQASAPLVLLQPQQAAAVALVATANRLTDRQRTAALVL